MTNEEKPTGTCVRDPPDKYASQKTLHTLCNIPYPPVRDLSKMSADSAKAAQEESACPLSEERRRMNQLYEESVSEIPDEPEMPYLIKQKHKHGQNKLFPEDQSILTLCIQSDPCCRTRKEIMLREAPIYPEKCARWTQRHELLNKRTLNALLYQCKSVEVLAKYLNCSKQQIYAAMDFHSIRRVRYRTSIRMKRSLGLRE